MNVTMAWGDMKQYRSLKTVWPQLQHGAQTPSQTQVADLSLDIHTALCGKELETQTRLAFVSNPGPDDPRAPGGSTAHSDLYD